MAVIYYLAEDFLRQYGRLSPRELAQRFTDCAPRSWSSRRVSMAKAAREAGHPEWVPVLDRQGRAVDDTAAAPPEADPASEQKYRESTEVRSDGSCVSDRLLEMDLEQSKDPAFLLQAHGFDPAEWELVNAKNNIWHGFSKDGDGSPRRTVLYSSRITAKPRVEQWSIADLVAAVTDAQTPKRVARPRVGKRLLELPYTDLHFGNSTIEWYDEVLSESLEIIGRRTWDEAVLWVGSDLFHCDNFKNTTSNGTPQSSVWWPDAWRDALEFMGTILEALLERARKVYVYYVPGNHDESMAWGFVQLLEARYPQAVFDTTIAERKVHIYGRCAIGMTHGDEKTRRDLDRVFIAEFPAFASASFREVHMGHLHHEIVLDRFGVISRSLSTAARTDKWHRESGFVGARKVFQLFEWEADRGVRDPHYV